MENIKYIKPKIKNDINVYILYLFIKKIKPILICYDLIISYLNIDTTLYIEDNITIFEPKLYSFENKYAFINLVYVYLPDWLKILKPFSFAYATNLKKIRLSKNLEVIDNITFYNCINLESIDLPDSLIAIGYSAFENCQKLKNIILPKNITILENRTFLGCNSLENINLENIACIKDSVFSNTNIKNITISENVKNMGWFCFSGCKNLESIIFLNPDIKTESYIFNNCDKLIDTEIYNKYNHN